MCERQRRAKQSCRKAAKVVQFVTESRVSPWSRNPGVLWENDATVRGDSDSTLLSPWSSDTSQQQCEFLARNVQERQKCACLPSGYQWDR